MNVPVNELKGIEAKVSIFPEELQTQRLPHTFMEQRRIYLIIEPPIPSQPWSWKVGNVLRRAWWRCVGGGRSGPLWGPTGSTSRGPSYDRQPTGRIVKSLPGAGAPTDPHSRRLPDHTRGAHPAPSGSNVVCICEWRRAARVVRASGARPCHRRPTSTHNQP